MITRRLSHQVRRGRRRGEPEAAVRRQGARRIRQDHGRHGGRIALRHVLPRAAEEFTKATGVEVEFISIPHDNIRQQFVLRTRCPAPAASTSISPTRSGCRSSTRRASSATSPGSSSDADQADFSKTALETVSYNGALVALPIMVHNCAMYYRTDLFETAGLSGAADELGRVSATSPSKTHRRTAGVWGTLIALQAGHRGLDPPALVLPAGRRRSSSTPTASRPSNSDAGHAALEFMTTMVFDDKAAPEGVLELPTCRACGSTASSRMAPVWPYLYSLSQGAAGRQVRDRAPRPASEARAARSIRGASPPRPARRTPSGAD